MFLKKLASTALVLVILFSASGAFAWGGFGHKPRPEKAAQRFCKELGLTAEQKEKFLAGDKEIREEGKALMDKNKQLFDKVDTEIKKDNPDKNAIRALFKQIEANTTEMHLKRIEHLIEFRKELTPEQKEKLNKMGMGPKRSRPGDK